ncbi:DUF1996 domain-containing protein [Mycena sanguinolenta]|uniref:DUF1996 domain-containing protein n=1 Tax=Mycena sanguinolenta TaxID=230812 RepID=A0A8H6ZD55_9AGAR|nr:DUF1996 domain-containing protein [Mycena sanguinolenta]
MARNILSKFLLAAAVLSSANAYFLFAMNDVITTERIDPIVSPGKVAGHVHSVFGGSNFRVSTNTSYLRQSGCTSSPITEDKSNYWAPTLYFQWKNGSFTSVNGSPVMYVASQFCLRRSQLIIMLAFRMLSGTPTLRSYDSTSFAQQAITFLCLDFNGVTTKFNQLPAQKCPSGVRAQINFPSCWDGVNADSADHKSHVAYLSNGPDSGTCSDPKYPVTLPRVFMEMYLDTVSFADYWDQAMNPSQPFVYSMGDPTGYGYHADFMMGWDKGVLDQVVNKCQCTSAAFGDPTCCSTAGYFNFTHGGTCRITKGVDEITTGTLPSLPGNNPVVPLNGVAANLAAAVTPALIEPVYYYTGDSPTQTGAPIGSPVTATGSGATSTSAAGATTSAAASSASTAKATSTNGAGTTVKGASSTQAGSAPTSSPGSSANGSGSTSVSGSNSGPSGSIASSSGSAPTSSAGSPAKGSGSGSNSGYSGSPGSPGSPGSGSASSAGSAPTSSAGSPAKGSSSGSGTNSGSSGSSGSNYGSSSGPSSSSGSPGSPANGSPANGSSSSSPSKGSNSGGGSNSGTVSSPASPASGGNQTKTCKNKKTKRAAHRARAFHESSRRRFSSPQQRFVDDDF